MSYTVLARKYRPQTFDDLVGQEHVTRTLGNAIKTDRVAHAFLFTGARGVGKTSAARLLAKALNCAAGPGPTATPCNACDPCRNITAGSDMDVLEIDGASNNSVDDVRRLQETLPFRPARDRFKVVIVDEVHMLSTGAFNAFLKTLEEPPDHVKFIFATTELHKVPVTIRSRCQRHDFRLIPHAVVAERVRTILALEKIEADAAAIAVVAREAAGSMRDALTVLDQLLAFGGDKLEGADVARGLGIADRKHLLETAGALLAGDAVRCLTTVRSLADQGLDMLHFARALVELMRDLVVLRVAGDAGLVDLVQDEQDAARRIAEAHNPQTLERAFAGVSRLVDEVGQSGHPQLTLEMGLVRLADRPALEPLAELLGKLQGLEGRLGHGGTGGSAGGGPGRAPAGRGDSGEPRGGPRSAAPAREPSRNAGPPPSDSKPAARTAPTPAPAPATATATAPAPAPATATAPAPPVVATAGAGSAQGGPPPEWYAILEQLRASQPALAAMLEHGVALSVSPELLRIGFPEGSFYGKQASAKAAQDALRAAAERVLGRAPELQFGSGDTRAAGRSVAETTAAARDARHEELKHAALNHPRVKEALEIFPETAGNVTVQVTELDLPDQHRERPT